MRMKKGENEKPDLRESLLLCAIVKKREHRQYDKKLLCSNNNNNKTLLQWMWNWKTAYLNCKLKTNKRQQFKLKLN